jgi:UDP-glucose 4-epimerase
MRTLVTGSSGFVGRHLISRLIETGNNAIPLVRGPTTREGVFAGPPDLADIAGWPSWPREIDTVFHLAALNPERGSRLAQHELNHANADATEALARRCVAEGVRRMVFVSTALVHPSGGVESFDESAPLAPQNPYAQSKRLAEERFWAALHGSPTEGCAVRPVPVFGPGGRGMIGALLKLARLPIPLPLRGLGGPRSIVSMANLIDALLRCAQAPEAAGRTFLVADAQPLTVAEIVGAFRRALGRSEALLPAPTPLLRGLATVAGKGDVWRALDAPFVADTTAIQKRLSWSPRVSTQTALAELAHAMRDDNKGS